MYTKYLSTLIEKNTFIKKCFVDDVYLQMSTYPLKYIAYIIIPTFVLVSPREITRNVIWNEQNNSVYCLIAITHS